MRERRSRMTRSETRREVAFGDAIIAIATLALLPWPTAVTASHGFDQRLAFLGAFGNDR